MKGMSNNEQEGVITEYRQQLLSLLNTERPEDAVVKFMRMSSSMEDWNKRCDEVKLYFDGKYPSFWYSKIIISGVQSSTFYKFYKFN
ncbi:MAG: hypothetical protein Fur0024_3440 [Patescibacteria group bacterium]